MGMSITCLSTCAFVLVQYKKKWIFEKRLKVEELLRMGLIERD
jgi:hypothetical protein